MRTLFRASATLRKPVHVETLQASLEATLPRFPYYAVHVRRGVFWPYLEANNAVPQVLADSRYPCEYLSLHRGQAFPFRVRAFHRRVAVEFSHILTDGNGALHFLRSLVAEYLRRHEGLAPDDPADLMLPGQVPDPEESEDAFRRYHTHGLPKPEPRQRTWHLPQTEDRAGTYHITSGTLSLAELKAQADSHRVTVTEFLCALLLKVLQDLHDLDPPRRKRPITVDVPVNLRQILPSRSLRNFFVTVQVSIDPRLGHYPFDQILESVHHRIRHQLTEKELRRQIARNVGAERHPLLRTIPRVIKGRAMPEIYRRVSLLTTTSSLSNLGRVTLPPPLDAAVERFDLVPIHPNLRKVACACIGYGGTLVITFGCTLKEAIVERLFFRELTERGCHVHIESNRE
jgi:NRPS condensation-like uncharacterized protein